MGEGELLIFSAERVVYGVREKASTQEHVHLWGVGKTPGRFGET